MEPAGALTSATERLMQNGLLGIFVVIFGMVIWMLWRESKSEREAHMRQIAELQAARLADAKAAQDQLLGVVRDSMETLNSVVSTLEGEKLVMMELRTGFKELGDEVREATSDRHFTRR